MSPIISVKNLKRSYTQPDNPQAKIEVLKHIDLDIGEGEFVGIMGKSGGGKTTLLKILGLIDRPTSGEVFFEGQNTNDLWVDELADIRRRKIGFVFQDFRLMEGLTGKENIFLPAIIDKRSESEMTAHIEKYAPILGITHLLEKKPAYMSIGERQRVAICRALINDPKVILADEPTGNLDSASGEVVMDIFNLIHQELGKTIVMITHDNDLMERFSRLVFVKDGLIDEESYVVEENILDV